VIEILGRTVRLVFGPSTTPSERAGPAPRPQVGPLIAFSAYAAGSRLFGYLRLDGERLTDMLNTFDELVLVDVIVERLADGRILETKEMTIARDELIAIEASGPRGNPGRRVRVRPFPIAVKLGEYFVRGYVHVTPGADPPIALRRKRSIVPLTEATIDYQRTGTLARRRSSTILFNRELVDWIAPIDDEAIEYLNLPASVGPLAKDFTGQILLDR
jgi:hypothetical protein